MTSSCHANVQDLLLIHPLEVPEAVWAVAVARRRVLDITSAFSSHGACPMQGYCRGDNTKLLVHASVSSLATEPFTSPHPTALGCSHHTRER